MGSNEEQDWFVLLHLSDIHFTTRSNGHLDLDRDLRDQLELDLDRVMVDLPAPIQLIAVTGDISYSGLREEFETAWAWLDNLTKRIGCPEEAVVTVPGNHDVDWNLDKEGNADLVRSELRGCDVGAIDEVLESRLNDHLLAGHREYNRFAARYRCEMSSMSHCWDWSTPLCPGWQLTFRGITTSLVSDRNDAIEGGRMVVGTYQVQVPEKPGEIRIALAHHPPSWVRDEDTMRLHLRNRAHLQLFGHKHTHDIERVNNSVVAAAGAVHPERAESMWEPRYNLIALRVERRDDSCFLTIHFWPRVWKPGKTAFGAGDEHVEEIELGPCPNPAPEVAAAPVQEEPMDARTDESATTPRRLSWGFHSPQIGFVRKLQILIDLDLVEADDDVGNVRELYPRAFKRAAEREQIDELWFAVDRELGGALGTRHSTEEEQ